MLVTYCEMRNGFRFFRLDLIQRSEAAEGFDPDEVKSLNGYIDYLPRSAGENGQN